MAEVIHVSEDGIEETVDGFPCFRCECGWQSPPCPDNETVLDMAMQHAYEAGLHDGQPSRPGGR